MLVLWDCLQSTCLQAFLALCSCVLGNNEMDYRGAVKVLLGIDAILLVLMSKLSNACGVGNVGSVLADPV